MRWIGFDPGASRCGLAVSDAGALLASPVAVIPLQPRGSLAERVCAALAVYGAPFAETEYSGLICGLPLNERGREGEAALLARQLGEFLHGALLERLAGEGGSAAPAFELLFLDERFSTRHMASQRRAAGVKGSRLKDEIDAWAAVAVLQDFLDRPR